MTHAELIERAARWLRNTKNCGVVLTERRSWAAEVPDAIGWSGGVSHVVECKVSRADFFADRHKPWRQTPAIGMGRYRWFCAPDGLLRAEEMPAGFGLIQARGRAMRVTKPADACVEHDGHKELLLLVSELRRYQLHGITYPPLADGSMPGRLAGFESAPIAPDPVAGRQGDAPNV